MNHTYRLVWNRALNLLQVASELAGGHARGGHASQAGAMPQRRAGWCGLLLLLPLTAWAGMPTPMVSTTVAAQPAAAPSVNQLPTSGQVVSGQGNVQQHGNTLTIDQQSATLSLNWQSFSIGSNATVDFLQPNASAIAINRVLGTDPSQIFGHLNANGQVFLINPNGVLFGANAQVNVGGLVASTLDLADGSLGSGTLQFGGSSTASVVNRGTITAAPGGYVALIGNTAINQGAIHAQEGSVALAGGSAVSLNFDGDQLVGVQVDRSTLSNLAQNGALIEANGGQVWMTAGARDSLLASAVNNTGVVEAQTVQSRGGTITLLSGMDAGTTTAGGTLDASAPNGGDGGQIDTSGATVKVTNGATVTTLAANGRNGDWLIDPNDFTIAPGNTGTVSATGVPSGDISGATLGTALASGNVTIESSEGSTAGSGNINVDDTVSWSANTLTLTAANNVNINAVMTASGTAGLALNPATANGSDAAVTSGIVNVMLGNGEVNFTGTGNSLSINGNAYTLVTSAAGLNTMSSVTSGYYALGQSIDASTLTGFTPIGGSTSFSGVFDGLGNTISNLTINLPNNNKVGLFGESTGTIRNLGLIGGKVSGGNDVGGLVGWNTGTVNNAYATGAVSDTAGDVGDLVGVNFGTISDAYATGAVSGLSGVGGLVGYSQGTINGTYATGTVSGTNNVGGLVGFNDRLVGDSYATGTVSGSNGSNIGGLVGDNLTGGTVTDAYATGAVSISNGSNGSNVGGLVGVNGGRVNNAYATGAVSGVGSIGGLVGDNTATITDGYWDTTTGGATGVGAGSAAGAAGLATAALESALPAGFSTGTWGNANNQTTPYLLGMANNQVFNANDTSNTLYTVIQNVNQLQAVQNNLAGDYVLGNAIDASATSGWNGGAGFTPIGIPTATAFTGVFDGLGFTISNLTIDLPNNNFVGLFSQLNGTIRNLGLLGGAVSGGFENVGGLVGGNAGTVSDVYVTGAVSGSENVGGLVGANTGTVSNAYATGAVSGSLYVGGLVGANEGTVSDVYATGAVSGAVYVGGLIGANRDTVSNAYATGTVSGSGSLSIGGLVGNNAGTITDGYWDTTTGGSTGVGGGSATGASGLTTAQLEAALPGGFTTRTWGNANNQTTPYLLGMAGNQVFNANDSSSTLYTVIQNVNQLQAVQNNLAGHYVLGNAIDASATSGWNGGAGFAPLGSSTAAFTGVFDGLGFTISNLTINNNGLTYAGLFGVLNGAVSNVALVGGSVTDSDRYADVGGLAGYNFYLGTISNVYVTGTVSGAEDASVGGLVGFSYGSITNAFTTGAVSAGMGAAVGGLVGYNDGRISNVYVTGTVTGEAGGIVGGLVGLNLDTITSAYAVGAVSGGTDNGGLVGSNEGGLGAPVSYGYWNATTTGQSQSVGGSSVTTAQLESALPAGFSAGTWGNANNQTTPYLLGMAGNQVFNANDTSNTLYTVIQNVNQLQAVQNNLAGRYVLGNAIDASATSGWNGGAGFAPLGSSTTAFSGVFDGLGFTISNLTINLPSSNDVGLFGQSTGAIRNLGLIGGEVGGGNSVGGLVGWNTGTVSNAYATGAVGGSVSVGDLVGVNQGTVSDAYATGAVSDSIDVGGLVGDNQGTVSDAYATGAVSGTSYIGGLVGDNQGTVSDAYATGAVSGARNVGGLIGINAGTVSDAYATGAVSGTQGIIIVGGLVGDNFGGTITNSYWDTTTGGATGVGSGSATGATGLTTAQLEAALPTGFGTGTWGNANNQTTPYLLGLVGNQVFEVNDSSNTLYTVIQNVNQLQAIQNNLSGYYVLGNAIDASATSGWSGGAGFAPIGGSTTPFTGVFDGLGFTISNLTINLPSGDYVGLFGESTGAIRNLGLIGGATSGEDSVGGLVGANEGTVSDAYVTGTVSGLRYVGGLAGVNAGTVSDAYATGTVSGTVNVGGLVGFNLAGVSLEGGTVSDAYATGAVSGAAGVGGLVGNNEGTITDGYWDTTTGGSTGVGLGGTTGASGLTTAQLEAALPGGFATSTWGNANNQTTPYLLGMAGNQVFNANDSGNTLYTVIQNVNQLQAIQNNLSGYYVLGNAIDASTTSGWNGGAGFAPIGESTPFAGVFDGLGFTIGGLTINNNLAYDGLFGQVGSSGVVRNVGLVGGSVTDVDTVTIIPVSAGDLVGNNLGTITNAYATGAVSGYISNGGLVGTNSGTITNAYATGAVSGGVVDGGLVGEGEGTITNAYATGAVSGSARGEVGGLVGENRSLITNAYATGAVSGGSYDGGLVGYNYVFGGAIKNAYATGAVSGSFAVGGLAGEGDGSITDAYATGAVSVAAGAAPGSTDVGGLVGRISNGTITSAYWDTVTSGTAIGVGSGSTTGTTGLATSAWLVSGPVATSVFTSANGWVAGYPYPVLSALPYVLVTCTSCSQTYGSSTPTITGIRSVDQNGNDASALLNTSGLTWFSSASATDNAGTAVVLGGEGGTVSAGYQLTYIGTNGLTVSPANLVLSGTRTYDGTTVVDGSMLTATGVNGQTFSVSGAGDSSNLASANVQSNSTLASVAGLILGTSSNGGLASNYNILSVTGSTVSITPATLTVTADAANQTYDGLAYSGGNGVTYKGFVDGQAASVLGGTLGYGGSAQGAVNAGSYTITPNGLTSSNYAITFAPGTLTVNPAALTVTANAASQTYDGLAYSGGNGVTYKGFVDGQTASVLGGTLGYGGGAQGAVNAGSYAITPTGLTSSNYAITFAPGTLTIDPATLTVSLIGTVSKTYDSTAQAMLSAANYQLDGVLGSDAVSLNDPGVGTYASVNVGTGLGVSVGGLTLGGAAAGNYVLLDTTASAPIGIITPATLTYVATPVQVGRGQPLPPLGGTVTGFQGSDTLASATTGNLQFSSTVVPTTPAGSYAITGSGLSANDGDYVFVQSPGNASGLTVVNDALPSLPGVSYAQQMLGQPAPFPTALPDGPFVAAALPWASVATATADATGTTTLTLPSTSQETGQGGAASNDLYTPDVRVVGGGVRMP
ncbi:GLUG motif-containing protein [Dyella mobilis]|uniref:Filamentous hemagglutinin N-terminal domain-containing protein n=1 Tax=Dyella mobilis TaxID=1849582 RepID=A0ABS2KFM6_9GAMM|nr:GLUG motif-containing protein [Dyella mobilis]MBM7129978.1 filamentous hemagglutinin N-terminal domain-containing protein [Dyella mobilis]GLQ97757.1 hypothetical protein GCM10007863_21770 [Dyella mobilis]